MKPILRRAAALVLCAALLIPTALASDALGSTIYDYTLDICDGTTLTREVMWSASKSDLRTENYVTYTPSGSISPVVSYGTSVVSKQSVADMAKSLETDGHRALSGINGDYFVMATGDPLGLVVTDGVLLALRLLPPSPGLPGGRFRHHRHPQPGPEGQLQGVFPQNRGHQQDPHQHRVLHFHR